MSTLHILWEMIQVILVGYSLWQVRAWKTYWTNEREALDTHLQKRFKLTQEDIHYRFQSILELVQGHKKAVARWASRVNKKLDI